MIGKKIRKIQNNSKEIISLLQSIELQTQTQNAILQEIKTIITKFSENVSTENSDKKISENTTTENPQKQECEQEGILAASEIPYDPNKYEIKIYNAGTNELFSSEREEIQALEYEIFGIRIETNHPVGEPSFYVQKNLFKGDDFLRSEYLFNNEGNPNQTFMHEWGGEEDKVLFEVLSGYVGDKAVIFHKKTVEVLAADFSENSENTTTEKPQTQPAENRPYNPDYLLTYPMDFTYYITVNGQREAIEVNQFSTTTLERIYIGQKHELVFEYPQNVQLGLRKEQGFLYGYQEFIGDPYEKEGYFKLDITEWPVDFSEEYFISNGINEYVMEFAFFEERSDYWDTPPTSVIHRFNMKFVRPVTDTPIIDAITQGNNDTTPEKTDLNPDDPALGGNGYGL